MATVAVQHTLNILKIPARRSLIKFEALGELSCQLHIYNLQRLPISSNFPPPKLTLSSTQLLFRELYIHITHLRFKHCTYILSQCLRLSRHHLWRAARSSQRRKTCVLARAGRYPSLIPRTPVQNPNTFFAPVIHASVGSAMGTIEIPLLLQGKVPPAGDKENLGTRNYSKPAGVVIVGAVYGDDG